MTDGAKFGSLKYFLQILFDFNLVLGGDGFFWACLSAWKRGMSPFKILCSKLVELE